LWTCRMDKGDADLASGTLPAGKGEFARVPIVRFTKTFAKRRSNFFREDPLSFQDWSADRRRTVFVLNCAASTTFAGQRQLFLPAKGQQRECP
jgi:hypothetical protein